MSKQIMKNYISDNRVHLAIITGIILIFISLVTSKIDTLQKIFSIIGSFSLFIALYSYLYKKQQDALITTIDQINFFRKEIIIGWDETQKKVHEKDPNFVFSKIELQNPDLILIKTKYPKNFDRQLTLFFNSDNLKIDPILDKQIMLLNILEEFSLRVIFSNNTQHPALKSIYNAFVEIVEHNAIALLFMRDIKTGNKIYSGTLELYKLWQKNTEKNNYIKNLEKYGLITREKKEAFYKMKREKFGSTYTNIDP